MAEGQATLAQRIGTLPAKVIPLFVRQLVENDSLSEDQIRALVEEYADLSATEIPADYYYDWSSGVPFSLAGRGPGECGAGVMDVIAVDIQEAREALRRFAAAQETALKNQEIYQAVVASARALLILFGVEPKTEREILDAFRTHLVEPGWVEPATQELLDTVMDWRLGDKKSFAESLAQVGNLVERIERLFSSLDANLRFRLDRYQNDESPREAGKADSCVDLRGVACPLNFVKAKIELERVPVGEILRVLLDSGESVRNVPESFTQQGQDVMEIKDQGDYSYVRVRRKK